jgi:hypothetical protein
LIRWASRGPGRGFWYPDGESLPLKTWRTGAGYPEAHTRLRHARAGVQGEPLHKPCPELHSEEGAFCSVCKNSGCVWPERPAVETPTA